MEKRIIKVILFALVVLVAPIIIIFLLKFWNKPLSENISDWASFGDYIGGTINTIISLFTLFVTIIISYQISQLEDKRNEKNLEFEKRKFLRELRENEYNNISNELNKIWTILSEVDREKALIGIFELYHKYSDFIEYKKHLFPIIEQSKFIILKEYFDDIHKYFSDNEKINLNKIPHIQNISKEIQ